MKKKITQARKDHYINGQWISGKGLPFNSSNPMNQEIVWQGKNATPNEVIKALEAARNANTWALTDLATRIHFLKRFAEIVEAHRQELAEIISLETGKPFWESLTEVSAVVNKIEISIKAYHERNPEKSHTTPEAMALIRYKPQGVVVVLGAYNFPAHLSNGHIVPALLAGNTVIYKPSELAPAVAAFIMQCWHETGIPAGVINCLQGDGATGQNLLEQEIQGVFFTGSYQTGKRIHRLFSDRPQVILALEMGGNNPLIVDEVDNLDAAVYMTLLSTLLTAGQRCTCVRRIFIPQHQQGELFLQRLLTTYQKILIGGFSQRPEPFMGPVINLLQAANHLKTQAKLIQLGGIPLLTMTQTEETSALLTPGVIDMSLVKTTFDEEIFAPFVQIYRYEQFEQAIEKANATKYGLAAGLLSNNPKKYQLFFQNIKAGLINWNRPTTGAASNLPFGGIGCSGNHRPSAYYAADYCSYPIASMENPYLHKPEKLLPGITMEDL